MRTLGASRPPLSAIADRAAHSGQGSVSRTEPTIALTFDDGPDPMWTPIILRELDRLDVCATFFVIAPHAAAHPALVRSMREAGHGVELHCWNHDRHSESDREALEAETDLALAELAVLGIHPSRWRTPWADIAPWTAAVAARRGLAVTGWTADSHDWRAEKAEEMLGALRPDLNQGAVVRLHDGMGPGARRPDCLQTMRLLAPLIRWIRSRGLELSALEPVSAVGL